MGRDKPMSREKHAIESHLLIRLALIAVCIFARASSGGDASIVEPNYTVSEVGTIHRIPVSSYGKYTNAEVFIDAFDRVIALCAFEWWNQGNWEGKNLLLTRVGGTWAEKQVPAKNGVMDNGHLLLYSIGRPEKNKVAETVTVFRFDSEAQTLSQVQETVTDSGKKAFAWEAYRHSTQLLALRNGEFFVVGYYREQRLSPIDVLGTFMSAGHWGFVQRVFGVTVQNDRITGYYNIPENPKTGEYVDRLTIVVSGGKVHTVWLKSREYSPLTGKPPESLQYSSFDLSEALWARPIELFRGCKRSNESSLNRFSPPSLAGDGENVYCAWSWTVTDRSNIDRPVRQKESGVYFCIARDGVWSKPTKISDSGIQPKVVVTKNGEVYVFWIVENHGLFYRMKTDAEWSEAVCVVKDDQIRTKETGLPTKSVTSPIAIALDNNSALHALYIRSSRDKPLVETERKPEELVYVKLVHVE